MLEFEPGMQYTDKEKEEGGFLEMFETLSAGALAYVQQNQERLIELIEELTAIPAPSHHEEKRAAFIRDWLTKRGARGVIIDEALNVVLPMRVDAPGGCTLFLAHTDTVFPDLEPLPVQRRDGRLYGPGVGDDTTNVAAMMLWCEYLLENHLTPREGVIIAFNSGEEGLGNLKGVCQLMETYGKRIRRVYAFDGGTRVVVNGAVGSARWKVTVRAQGGHSYSKFGNSNAIVRLSEIICELYRLEVPRRAGRTTYNVGVVEGGTSVNTIAQDAHMLYEIRSDNRQSLEEMQACFEQVICSFRDRGYDIEVELLGLRPCMGEVDKQEMARMSQEVAALIERECGARPSFEAASTDCNIPYSMGVPGLCFGVYTGAGSHTREEYIELSSLPSGLRTMGCVILHDFVMDGQEC